jgi:hypothetical protein
MTKEDEALEWARDMVKKFRDEKTPFIFGTEVLAFSKEDSRHVTREMMKMLARNYPQRLPSIIEMAKEGVGAADEALRELIAEINERGDVLPYDLAAYCNELLEAKPRRHPGRAKTDYWVRDLTIVTIVLLLTERFGLTPTGRSRSACHVVATALHEARMRMSYEAVEKIWLRYHSAL